MTKPSKKHLLLSSLILALLITFGLGFFVGRTTKPFLAPEEPWRTSEVVEKPKDIDLGDADFNLFWDAWQVVVNKYVDRKDLDYQEMIYGAISGMVKSLGDPYAEFMKPEDSKKFLEDMGGSFEGIGAEIGIRKGILTIIAPLEDTPAERAGIKAGDKVIKIDDTFSADLTLDEAVSLIRGPKGTEVKLTINREGLDEDLEIKIIRNTIKIPILRWRLLENRIAYIEFSHFTQNAPEEFRKVAGEILASNAESIILDLRNNPGGYLETAQAIASWFIPKGELVAIEDFGNGEKIEYRSKGYGKLNDFPIVVLTNQGSASASEIVAGALRDIRGIKIVGETTFGKGSVQELERLKQGSSLKLTVAKWLTPSGKSIAEEGLEPDIKVEMTVEDYENDRDPQLDEAIAVLALPSS